MCLYPRKLRNPKYLPNEKNGGRPTRPPFKHLLYIETKCGWCEECRKELGNDWRQRLQEEMKSDNTQEMVTLTFSPEAIKSLKDEMIKTKYKGIESDDIDVNLLASFAVRRFTERYRKKYKKAPKHWLITELGHENSERIHMHGIIWGKKPRHIIQQLWSYGNIDWGDYCNIRTINYIIKYVLKIDTHNIGYRQRIFCSKGIGKEYLTNNIRNQYNGEDTCTTYRDAKGYTYKLSKYYKHKLYTDEQREALWTYYYNKGKIKINNAEFDKAYQDDMDYRDRFRRALKRARQNNEQMGYGNNKSLIYRYLITEKMMMKKAELELNKNMQEIRAQERRNYNILTAPTDFTDELNKTIDKDDINFTYYIGSTTEGERKLNAERREAEALGVSIRILRLVKKGIVHL